MRQIFLSLVLVLGLAGCQPMTPATKEKVAATGQLLAQKAFQVAVNTIIARVQSPNDAQAKANWLDSLAYAVRITPEDVQALVGVWTPKKSHWAELAGSVDALYESAKHLPPDQRRELIAQGLNAAAAKARGH